MSAERLCKARYCTRPHARRSYFCSTKCAAQWANTHLAEQDELPANVTSSQSLTYDLLRLTIAQIAATLDNRDWSPDLEYWLFRWTVADAPWRRPSWLTPEARVILRFLYAKIQTWVIAEQSPAGPVALRVVESSTWDLAYDRWCAGVLWPLAAEAGDGEAGVALSGGIASDCRPFWLQRLGGER